MTTRARFAVDDRVIVHDSWPGVVTRAVARDDGWAYKVRLDTGSHVTWNEASLEAVELLIRTPLDDRGMRFPVTSHLIDIWKLLRNGANVQVILVKADGERYTYELPWRT